MRQQQQQSFMRRLIDAIRAVIGYVVFGLFVGVVLVWLSTENVFKDVFLPAKASLGDKLLEHVGMGFIVAAIAVLFYEWGAHLKALGRVSTELTELRVAVAEVALDRALKVYVDTGDADLNREVIESVTRILEHLKQLQDKGDWAQLGFQQFISAMIERVSVNAGRLAELSSALKKDPASAASRKVDIHTPVELVDTILAEQVRRLPQGSRYSVVANPQDWQEGQFEQLLAASKTVVETNGVLIRRILVLTDRGPNAYAGDRNAVAPILEKHMKAAESWKTLVPGGGYTFKVLDESEQNQMGKMWDDAAENIRVNHFAIIAPAGTRHYLQVKANKTLLDDFQVEGVPTGSGHIQWFDLVWERLPQMDTAKMRDVLERWTKTRAASLPGY